MPATWPRVSHPARACVQTGAKLAGSFQGGVMTEVLDAQTERASDVKRISHWIGGRSVAGESGRSGPVYNPATGEQSGAVDFASVEEVDSAVHAAREAFPGWR